MRLKRASLLTKLVITVLLIYMATSLLDLWGQIQSAQSQREELAIQVEQQRLAAGPRSMPGMSGRGFEGKFTRRIF